MLPVVAGVKITKINIFVYGLILFFVSLTPFFFGYFGITYFLTSISLGTYYIYLCYKLLSDNNNKDSMGCCCCRCALFISVWILYADWLVVLR